MRLPNEFVPWKTASCGDSTLTKLASIQIAASVPNATAIVKDLVADQLTQRLQVHEQRV